MFYNWLPILYIIVLEYSVNMPAICKSDGDTPRLEKKRSIRMKVKVEIEKQTERCDPQMGAKIYEYCLLFTRFLRIKKIFCNM